MTTMLSPIAVEFPLRGEWVVPNTPARQVPSHGTDKLGVRYAYDFVGVDSQSRRKRYYRSSPLRYLLFGLRLPDFYGWGQPIFSTTAGTVVQAADGWPERNPVHPIRDLIVRVRNARAFASGQATDYRLLTGNYIIVESEAGYVVYAHAQTGTVQVAPGDRVIPGQHLANVGHSGNSTAPHLHFHLMDHLDPRQAQGIPCRFREYEVFRDNAWHLVQDGIPGHTERIRRL